MIITETLVRAVAARHSVAVLQHKLDEALAKLSSGSVITQASGPGTSYQRTITMKPDEAVQLYSLAIDYKLGQLENPLKIHSFSDPGTAC